MASCVGGRALLLERSTLRLQRFHRGLRLADRVLQLGEAGRQRAARGQVRRLERLQLGFQPLAALRERLARTLQVGEVRLLELLAAFGLDQRPALLVEGFLRRAEGVLGLRQAAVLVFQGKPAAGDLLFRFA